MNRKIIIIGAGAAGMAAATKLMEHGFCNITILEAEGRIGGRINTVAYASNVVDMGAQWCHGQQKNVVYELAKKHSVLDTNKLRYDTFTLIQSDGTTVPLEVSQQLMKMIISIVEIHKDEMKQYQGSLGNFIMAKYTEALQLPELSSVDPVLAQQFIEFFHKYENSIEASDTWFDASCSGYVEYWDCEGDRLLNWKDKGYRTLFDLLMKKIPNPSETIAVEEKIVLDKEVRTIVWKSTGAPYVTVECTDGSAYDADHVIATMSLGVLKERYRTMFQPELPAIKTNAIEGLTLGTVDKIYLEFAEPFWPDTWDGFSLLWSKADQDALKLRPDDAWLEDVFGFFTVDYQPNILCGWVSGKSARVMEQLPEADVQAGTVRLLRTFLKEFTVPEPVSLKRSQWYTNPHFRGSYSFRSMKSDLLKTSAADLALPITNALGVPILHFAGEATHDHYYSTVHGAVETGWREAKRIIDLYKTNSETSKIKNPNGRSVKDGTTTTTLAIVTNDITVPSFGIAEPTVDVLILGAGLAGLGAATTLKAAGRTFLLLEGQSKAGGRVNTMELLPYGSPHNDSSDKHSLIDAGAQWLHGRHNDLHTIATRYDLLSHEQSAEGLGAFIRDDGTVLDEYLVKKTDFFVGQILSECEKYARRTSGDQPSYPRSVSSYLLDNFQPLLCSAVADVEQQQQAMQLLDWHVRFQVIDNSCLSLEHVSAKSWGQYSYNGESCQAHYNFKRGFSSATDALYAQLGATVFRFNHNVVGIECSGGAGPRISVKCSDGSVYQANHVIVTFSVGSLKYGLDVGLFRPELPPRVVQTIRDIGFETINKLFFQFDHAWWGDLDGIQLVFKNEHYENNKWTRHISGFDVLKPGPQNTLLAWVGGIGAIEMEQLSDQQIVKDCVAVLAQFTGTTVPPPIKYYCTRWHNNRFIRGAYSYISTDCDTNETSSRHLAQPITLKDLLQNSGSNETDTTTIKTRAEHEIANNQKNTMHACGQNSSLDDVPILLFAGEACHDQYFSTAHGAFMSGIEQATKILSIYE